MKDLLGIIFDFQKERVKLEKTADNPFFKSSYIPLDDILNYLIPKLTEKGILLFHRVENRELVTTLYHNDSGQELHSRFPLNSTDPQKQGSEITYGKRYNLNCIFNIQETDDDDGNIASSEGNTKKFYDNSKKEKPKFFNYEDLVETVEAGNTTDKDIAKVIKEDGFTLSQYAKNAIRHYLATGEIDKNLFYKPAK